MSKRVYFGTYLRTCYVCGGEATVVREADPDGWTPVVGSAMVAFCDKHAPASRRDGLGEWYKQSEPSYPPWRVRDRFARVLGFHCWDCMVAH